MDCGAARGTAHARHRIHFARDSDWTKRTLRSRDVCPATSRKTATIFQTAWSASVLACFGPPKSGWGCEFTRPPTIRRFKAGGLAALLWLQPGRAVKCPAASGRDTGVQARKAGRRRAEMDTTSKNRAPNHFPYCQTEREMVLFSTFQERRPLGTSAMGATI